MWYLSGAEEFFQVLATRDRLSHLKKREQRKLDYLGRK